jgi:hypothetical protein
MCAVSSFSSRENGPHRGRQPGRSLSAPGDLAPAYSVSEPSALRLSVLFFVPRE